MSRKPHPRKDQQKKQHGECPRFFGFGRLCALLGISALGLFFSGDAFAHEGEILTDQVRQAEQFLTGGYLRIGLLVVCGITAVAGAVQQNGWMFLSGILAGVFVFIMKGWITETFTYLI